MRYDLIVIGSGVSGMTAAIAAARHGRSVLVLEQADRPGGLMQTFRRNGSVFPVGVHRLGGLNPGQNLWRYLKYLGVLTKLRLVPMDPDGFEEYRFPDTTFRVPCGADTFRYRLLEQFPAQAPAIERFMSDMRQVVGRFPLYNLAAGDESALAMIADEPLQPYLDRLTDCPRLKSILCAANPLYGVEPSDCPLFVHFLVFDSFLQSAWRVDEIQTPLADAFVQSFQSLGGELRCRSRVAAIDTDNGAVQAVRLADGECIEAPNVVFTGHPRQLLDLCPPTSFRPVYRNRLRDLPDTLSVFGMALRWNRASCPLSDRDVYVYDSHNPQDHYRQRLLRSDDGPHLFYCSALPAAPDGRQAASVLCLAPADEWQAWSGSAHGARPPGYLAAKNDLAQRLLSRLAVLWPEAADAQLVDTFSPLTLRDYTLTPDGCAYGVRRSAVQGRSTLLSPRVRVGGLFLAGQSVVLPGILGSVISGINAWRALAGDGQIVEGILDETD